MFCFQWTTGKPKVVIKQTGTMISVHQYCKHCEGNPYTWRIQPYNPMFGRYPAVNVLLCLLIRASVSKKIFVCQPYRGLFVYHLHIFCTPEKVFIPSHSSSLQWLKRHLSSASWSQQKMHLEWDGRFDSIWHHAKYGAYSMVLWNNFENWFCVHGILSKSQSETILPYLSCTLLSYTIKDCSRGWVVC